MPFSLHIQMYLKACYETVTWFSWPFIDLSLASAYNAQLSPCHIRVTQTQFSLSHYCTIQSSTQKASGVCWRLRVSWIIENAPNLKPASGLPPINTRPTATWALFSSKCGIGLQKWLFTLTCGRAARPPPRICFLPLSWSCEIYFLVSQTGQKLVSQRGTDITPLKNTMMGKPMKNSWHAGIFGSCWGAFKCSSNKVTCIVLEWCLTCALLNLIFQIWTLTDIWDAAP